MNPVTEKAYFVPGNHCKKREAAEAEPNEQTVPSRVTLVQIQILEISVKTV